MYLYVFVVIPLESKGGTSPCDYGPSRISRKSEVGMTAAQLEVLTPDWGWWEWWDDSWEAKDPPPSWCFESMGLARHVGKKSTHRLTSSTYHLGPVNDNLNDNLLIFSKGHLFIFTFQFLVGTIRPTSQSIEMKRMFLVESCCGRPVMSVNVCPTSLHSPSDDRIHGWSMMLFAKDTWKKRQSDLFWDRCKEARAFCVLNLNMFNAAGNSGKSVFACAHCWLKSRSAQPAQLTSGQTTGQFWQLQLEKTSFSEFV